MYELILPWVLPGILAITSFIIGYMFARLRAPEEISYSADSIHVTASSPHAARAAFALAIKSRIGIKRYDDQP